MKVYFDNAATTPMAKEVIEEIKPYLHTYFGNPSSTHSFGRKTRNAIEIREFEKFYKAEAFHQDYYQINFVNYLRYKKACRREATLNNIWGS